MPNAKSYANQVLFITGGSSGIGKEIGRLFYSCGASVILFARDIKKITDALAEYRCLPALPSQTCGGYALDVRDCKNVLSVMNRACAENDLPDILINAAGFSYPDYFEKISAPVFHDLMDTNYFGAVHTCIALVPHFIKQRKGRIVNIASLCGFLPVFGYSGYTASKFALMGFSETLRNELKQYNIVVSVLCPPDTNTPGYHAEEKLKPAECREISKGARLMSTYEVARLFEKDFKKRKFLIIPGFEGKLIHFLWRHFPWIVNLFFNAAIKKARILRK